MAAPPTRTRMSPASRREQLLDLGVRLLATRPLDEVSIDMVADQAGISRGLLYHYFANLKDFQRAVCRRAADQLIAVTAPGDDPDAVRRLVRSLDAYVGYVEANYEGYTSLLRGAAGGDADLRALYEQARAALTDRIFDEADPAPGALVVPDTAVNRLLVRGWASMAEEMVVTWVGQQRAGRTGVAGPERTVTRTELLDRLAGALPALLALG